MKIIKGISRQQMQFSSLDDFITANNPVRIIEAFVEKLDITKLCVVLQQTKAKTGKQHAIVGMMR